MLLLLTVWSVGGLWALWPQLMPEVARVGGRDRGEGREAPHWETFNTLTETRCVIVMYI